MQITEPECKKSNMATGRRVIGPSTALAELGRVEDAVELEVHARREVVAGAGHLVVLREEPKAGRENRKQSTSLHVL